MLASLSAGERAGAGQYPFDNDPAARSAEGRPRLPRKLTRCTAHAIQRGDRGPPSRLTASSPASDPAAAAADHRSRHGLTSYRRDGSSAAVSALQGRRSRHLAGAGDASVRASLSIGDHAHLRVRSCLEAVSRAGRGSSCRLRVDRQLRPRESRSDHALAAQNRCAAVAVLSLAHEAVPALRRGCCSRSGGG